METLPVAVVDPPSSVVPAETVRSPVVAKPFGVAFAPEKVAWVVIVVGTVNAPVPVKVVFSTCQLPPTASTRLPPILTVPAVLVTLPLLTVTEPAATALLVKLTPAALLISTS